MPGTCDLGTGDVGTGGLGTGDVGNEVSGMAFVRAETLALAMADLADEGRA